MLIAGGAVRTLVVVRNGLVADIIEAFVSLFATSQMTRQPSACYSGAQLHVQAHRVVRSALCLARY